MTNKIQGSLRNLNRIMSDDYQELSDKYHALKLSHNRMRKLLKLCLHLIEDLSFEVNGFGLVACWPNVEFEYLHKRITLELYGLENYKGLKGGV